MIKKLPKEVWSKIQAGEVIDCPAAIVRELIDNSIDAKSQNIKIKVEDSNLSRIVLEDDGVGILFDDSHLLFTNHATSKISNFEDLENISSMGFRGEALFSIGNICHVNLKSRNLSDESGFELVIHGGKKILHQKIPLSKGTIISIQQVFFNIPAREKFLRDGAKEFQSLKQVFIEKAFANYDISFYLNNEKKSLYQFEKVENIKKRITQIYSNIDIDNICVISKDDFIKIKKDFIEKYEIEEINIFCSNRFSYSKNKSIFHFSFNKRSAIEENLLKRLKGFYSNYLPKGFYPYFFIEIKLNPSFLDCNIHPSKKTIKILEENTFINDLLFVLNKKLEESQYIIKDENFISNYQNKITFEKIDGKVEESFKEEKENNFFFESSLEYSDELSSENIILHKNNHVLDTNDKKSELQSLLIKGKFLGLLFDTYLLFEYNKKLLVVDQHAADERITFNVLIKEANRKKRVLLFPKLIEADNKNIDKLVFYFENAGIEISYLGKNKFQIFSIPDIVPVNDENNFINEMINYINEDNNIETLDIDGFINSFYRHIIAKSACHLSIKQKDILSTNEAIKLCQTLFLQDDFEKCPHGRPTFYIIDKENFEKTFLRKK